MFYDEAHATPRTEQEVKDRYGINPVKDSVRAMAAGIYPLIEVPDGYTASHYVKEGNTYRAIPLPISDEEMAMVNIIRREHVSLHELELDVVPEWQPDIIYGPGDHVKHEGKVYLKDDDGDNSEPDDVPGGWSLIR